jgi:hypothetical protein
MVSASKQRAYHSDCALMCAWMPALSDPIRVKGPRRCWTSRVIFDSGVAVNPSEIPHCQRTHTDQNSVSRCNAPRARCLQQSCGAFHNYLRRGSVPIDTVEVTTCASPHRGWSPCIWVAQVGKACPVLILIPATDPAAF